MLQIRRQVGIAILVGLCVSGALLAHRWRRSAHAREAKRELADIRAGVGWRSAVQWRTAADAIAQQLTHQQVVPATPPEARPKPVRVDLPGQASAPARIVDATSNVALDVTLLDAREVAAQSIDGYAVYPKAHRSGATMLERELPDGVEDYLSFETRPAVPQVDYQIALGDQVAGLRLVANTLEMVDEGGAPRLRAEPPYIAGADGVRIEATLAIEGCAVDQDASAPWGRAALDPGARTCTIHVRWPDEAVVYPAVLDPRWTATGSMTTPRQGHTATLLSTGKVLVAGGTSTGTTALASAELYDRTTGTWAATGSMTGARTLHTATQLNASSNSTTSGKVLVAGGLNGSTSQNTAQLYSPSAGTWTAAANLNAARHGQTATLLSTGKVLVAGGLNGTTVLNTAAIYDPSSGTGAWAATGNMAQAVKFHTATLLAVPSNGTLNNKVLVVGGNSGTASVSNVQLFDGTATWSSLTALSGTREGHTATALANGNVLIAGGKSGSTVLNTTALFNAASGSGSWTSAGTLTTARQLHAAVLLPSALAANGQVLLAGGNNGSSTLGSTELWNGSTTWTATTALPAPVQGETATLLPNNMVLIAGGANGAATVASAELYDASFSLSCTSNSQCATGFCVNGVCCDTACNGGCGACNLPGKVGTCSAATSGTVCRAQSGACDVAETCSGTSLTCPADAVAPLGSVCRSVAGPCDVPETCDGATKACPADGFAAATVVCRASTGVCDAAETCSGTSAACPADSFAPATTVCRSATGGCDVAETCTGTSAICPPDKLAAAGSVCRPAESLCDLAETCPGTSSVCPTDTFVAAGTTCGAPSARSPAPVCSGANGICPVANGTSDVLGFEAVADWSVDVSDSGTTAIVGLNSNRTQGAGSLEVAAQNFAKFNSAPMSSMGGVGSIVLVDVQLPAVQANPSWYGTAQMFVSSPSLGVNNVPLGTVLLTGLGLGTWQTLAFQMPPATAATLAGGIYSDLTFSIALNVPYNETGHYLLDNIRSIPDVVPSLLGVAQDGSTLKAVFDYVTTAATPLTIPYGAANGLSNPSGFIAAPPETPPTTFVSTTHAPFVATLSGSSLTWMVGGHSVTATPGSQRLTVVAAGDGTNDVVLPDGRKVNLDAVPPASPGTPAGPALGTAFNGVLNGQFAVSPSGAATYSVPIAIPPGIAGMAPNLALGYSSQASDGIAGQGWALAGLSMISRCPRTRQQDGYGRAVALDSLTNPGINSDGKTDGVCLDGQKLFEMVPGTGTCAASGSVSMCYTPEQQDFSTITLNTTGEFQVVTKSGETRYYGLQPADRVNGLNGNVPETAVWLLDHVVDAWGNYFDFHYNNGQANFTDTGIWVSDIQYTGATGGTQPAIAPFNTITFQYECRPDIRWSRFASLRVPQNQRLKSITTPQGTYSLTYTQAAPSADPSACGSAPAALGLSELQTIGYCAGTTCMQPLTFTWQGDASGSTWQSASGFALPSFVGIGKGLRGTQFIDIDGDGRQDFVLARANGNAGKGKPQSVTVLNTGTTWGPPLTGPTQVFPVYLSDLNDNLAGARFADMDGDGRPDIVVDFANVMCSGGVCQSCPVGQGPGNGGCSSAAKPYSPAVWLNRFSPGGDGGWEFHGEFGVMPAQQNNDQITKAGAISFTNPTELVTVADMDGDGRSDLILVEETIVGLTNVNILLNRGPTGGGQNDGTGQSTPWALQVIAGKDALSSASADVSEVTFQVQDVNRDGLPDLTVTGDYVALADGSAAGSNWTFMNTTSPNAGTISFGPLVSHVGPQTGTKFGGPTRPPGFGDADGDRFYDLIAFDSLFGTGSFTDPNAYVAAVAFGDGTGFGFVNGGNAYVQVLKNFAPQVKVATSIVQAEHDHPLPDTSNPIQNTDDEDFGFTLADINGDGLVDLIRNHENVGPAVTGANQGGIEILYNTGTTWLDPDGITAWQGPIGPSGIQAVAPSDVSEVANIGSAFVDLDGDGFLDLVQEEAADQGFAPGAWLNPNRPHVIGTFPNGLAVPTSVNYVGLTTAAAATTYKDDDDTDVRTKLLTAPILVVASTIGADGSGTGLQDTRTYTYHSLRQDPNGRGPEGFSRVEVQDQASDTVTATRYTQVYPYTGRPTEVDKFQLFKSDRANAHLVTQTETTYCNGPAGSTQFQCAGQVNLPSEPQGPLFVFPGTITDVAYLHPETDSQADTIETDNQFQYDAFGNPLQTTTTTTKTEGGAFETFSKTVVNTYVTNEEILEGKPDSTTVTGTGGTLPTKHTTSFEYATAASFGGLSSRLVLAKNHVEPGAGWPLQLDTAYAYDRFGNVITTTSCANDFGSCAPGAVAPTQSPPDPLHHPPFRTTSVSYDPSVLGVPVSYGAGRFPVTATDAAGHVQTTVYDPVLGVVLTRTDPNGIRACFTYDALGRQRSETERCGSIAPLTTTVERFVAPTPAGPCSTVTENCTAKVVTLTTPPDGNQVWTFTDDQGHTVETLTGGFDGSLVETRTLYDALGQVSQQSKPFSSTDQPVFTVTVRDTFNRIFTVTDPLGVIDGTGGSTIPATTTTTTTYSGSTIQTVRTVNGQTQTRIETKNAVGKPASVSVISLTGLVTTTYAYDADRNVTGTTDPAGNATSVIYDRRGRKQTMIDPDMGTWAYVQDGFGDLVQQIDPNARRIDPNTTGTTMTYDPLGRVLSKSDASGTAQWVYDLAPGAGIGKLAAMVSAPDPKLAGPCAVPLVTTTGGNRAGKSFAYDQFGQVQQVTECADGKNFVSSYTYDALGRQSTIRYPAVGGSQLAVGYHYTSLGYLQYLTDDSSDYGVLWQAKAMNALGQVTDEQTRNGVETVSNRNPLTGWLLSSTATAHADHDNLIQSWAYAFDEAGNLLARNRNDNVNALTSQETFGYDLLNRLTGAQVATSDGHVSNDGYAYDAAGNLTQKSGSVYTYGAAGGCAAGPHAVCTVGGGGMFTYDDDGNMTASGSRTVTYTTSNRVREIVSDPTVSQGNDTGTVDFMYGADSNRVVQLLTSGTTTVRTVYVGLGGTGKSLYEQITTGSTQGGSTTTQHAHYIYAGGVHGGNAFALRVLTESGTVSATKYYSFDHIGSVTAMSDEEGRVAVSGSNATALGYDAWGARRNPDETAAMSASFTLPIGAREFTGQEQIPDVGLVNMNGRVYDPSIGRFLSPDPNVQDASDGQSYNRYSYVLNNPLRYADPTGYFSWSRFGSSLASYFENPMNDFELVESIAVCVGTGGAGCLVFGIEMALYNAAVAISMGASFEQTAINTGIGIGTSVTSFGLLKGINPLLSLAIGSASAAATTALGNRIAGKDWLEMDVLDAAVISAGTGALTIAVGAVVSKASDAQAQGGGGSGESRLEAAHRFLDNGGFKLQDPTAGWGGGSASDPLLLADNTATNADIPGCSMSPCMAPDEPPPEFVNRGGRLTLNDAPLVIDARNGVVQGIGVGGSVQIFWGGEASAQLVFDSRGGVGIASSFGGRTGWDFGGSLSLSGFVGRGTILDLSGPYGGVALDLGPFGGGSITGSSSGASLGAASGRAGLGFQVGATAVGGVTLVWPLIYPQ